MDIHRCRFIDYTPHAITALEFNRTSVAGVAPQDLRLAVGRANGDIEIWNPRWSWYHETTLRGGKGRSIEGISWALGTDGQHRLFSIGGSPSITEWNLQTGLPLANYDCNAGIIWSIAMSPDCSKVAVGCDNGAVVLVDISGGRGSIEHLRILQRSPAQIMSLAWKDNDKLIGGCSDGLIRVWSSSSERAGRILNTMRVDKSQGESTVIWSIKVLKNGKQFASGDSSGSVKFWDGNNFSLLQSFKVHEADVLCLAADLSGETVFSAGVDRRIACFNNVGNKLKRWVYASNRLLHAHDIRALACYEGKGSSFLISGGVERTLVINHVKQFMDGIFRKIPITRHSPCISVALKARLVAMWADQTVKIWQIGKHAGESDIADQSGKKLVAKLTLSNEENISSAALSQDGSMLCVSTLVQTKLFQLEQPKSTKSIKYTVTKIDVPELSRIGASTAKFVTLPNQQSPTLILTSPESEIYLYNTSSKRLREVQTDTEEDKPHSLAYARNIYLTAESSNGTILATVKFDGTINLWDISKGKAIGKLIKLNCPPTAITFTAYSTLIVVTAEIKVLEFLVDHTGSMGLSKWSRRNSDILPSQLVNLVDKCCGVFADLQTPERIWLWGANWLAFVDTGMNIPTIRVPKRKRDQLGIGAPQDELNDDNEEINSSLLTPSSTPDRGSEDMESASRIPFWITNKYRPLLMVSPLGVGEIFVSERPPHSIALPPAFWADHRIKS